MSNKIPIDSLKAIKLTDGELDINYKDFLNLKHLKIKPKYLNCLKRLKINKISDLWIYPPRTFVEVNWIMGPSQGLFKKNISCVVSVSEHCYISKYRYIVKVLTDSNQKLEVVFFGNKAKYLASFLPINEKRIISGILTYKDCAYQISHPHVSYNIETNSIVSNKPVYNLTYGITNDVLINIIKTSFKTIQNLPTNWLIETTKHHIKLPNFKDAIIQMHKEPVPEYETIEKSKNLNSYKSKSAENRLAFDEILANQIANFAIKKIQGPLNDKILKHENLLQKKLFEKLPFELTKDQKLVISEINKNFKNTKIMNRLLQGDVGSGKTIIAIFAALSMIEGGFQVAFMAPTSILAYQHHKKIKEFLSDVIDSSEIVCLTGNETKSKPKHRSISNSISQGKAKIIIGTHTLFQSNVEFAKLGLVIIDEQHKFGVEQRLKLIEKNNSTHILLMSATPIPRTLLLTVHCDLDISYLREKPKNRKKIITSIISIKKLDKLNTSIKKAIEENKKMYWVCPLIEPSDNLNLMSIEERGEELQKFINIQDIAIIHGRLCEDKKNTLIKNFIKGEKKILLTTTVIEVGIDVPNADIIIIENAENYGLSQLHQLRGRVGRSDKQSYCVLLYDENKISHIGRQRLSIIQSSSDGFYIAEKDLSIRGGGEITGIKQSGYHNFHFFDFSQHSDFLPCVKDMAKYIVNNYDKLSYNDKQSVLFLLSIFNCNVNTCS